ncbi:hypothetical protein ANO11243_079490 [Dothideomycetidae sp. 11243]|nr:hypothetical protein ANO11243_079490 [fungal sp. No.11243]
MVLNTLTVGAAVTPNVIGTAISHYIKRKPLRGKPTAHISYDEGLHLVRQFLEYASNHTVDEVQAFTAQWVPCPRWVKTEEVTIPASHLKHAASLLTSQLGPSGVEVVGGSKWWQWRPEQTPLKGEWIEMRKDYTQRKSKQQEASRIILYIHGGAYYFGSVDEHRYQLQRHARKLKARMLAPRYRLAPQFPFPCGLHDALAAYLFLLQEYDASSILVAGDSAGGGMVISLLVILRDQGIALPAGALLLSPWVDLTHSFPSVSGEGELDYIPSTGFHHRPSLAWPPPNANEMKELRAGTAGASNRTRKSVDKQREAEAVAGVRVEPVGHSTLSTSHANGISQGRPGSASMMVPTPDRAFENLCIEMDGKRIEILDQIQMYATNQLLTHPLVSPVMQPTLGGLPPLLIQTGGGELLRDEQVYLAHKAANPSAYPAPEAILDHFDPDRKLQHKYPPTKVHLQMWEDLCHVPHTLSFTRPAKHMYRAVAQFGNWCYANSAKIAAGESEKDDDAQSTISSDTDSDTKASTSSDGSHVPRSTRALDDSPLGTVAANEPLPEFKDNMIRQMVDRHGTIYALAPANELPGCTVEPSTIGAIKPGPVRKWLKKKEIWDRKFASQKRKVQLRRADEIRKRYERFVADDGTEETPPPTALAGRRSAKINPALPNLASSAGKGKKKSWGLAVWSGWGSKHDTTTVESTNPETTSRRRSSSTKRSRSRSASAAQRSSSVGTPARSRLARGMSSSAPPVPPHPSAAKAEEEEEVLAAALPAGTKVPGSENTFIAPNSARPHNGTVAYPFKLRHDLTGGQMERSASTVTLQSGVEGVDGNETKNYGNRFSTDDEQLYDFATETAEICIKLREKLNSYVRQNQRKSSRLKAFVATFKYSYEVGELEEQFKRIQTQQDFFQTRILTRLK